MGIDLFHTVEELELNMHDFYRVNIVGLAIIRRQCLLFAMLTVSDLTSAELIFYRALNSRRDMLKTGKKELMRVDKREFVSGSDWPMCHCAMAHGPYWDIKWALDNCCLISVFVNIQRCLKQTIRQYETKIKGTGWE